MQFHMVIHQRFPNGTKTMPILRQSTESILLPTGLTQEEGKEERVHTY